MMGMHLVQGLDFGVAQGGDILHEVCSLNIGWIKAHRDTSMGRMQSSGAILSKSDWISYQNLCPGTYHGRGIAPGERDGRKRLHMAHPPTIQRGRDALE